MEIKLYKLVTFRAIVASYTLIVLFCFDCRTTAMADNIEALASAPLLLRERRKSISLMLFRFIGVVLLAVATFYLFVGNFSSWTGSVKNGIIIFASLCLFSS